MGCCNCATAHTAEKEASIPITKDFSPPPENSQATWQKRGFELVVRCFHTSKVGCLGYSFLLPAQIYQQKDNAQGRRIIFSKK
jgi:hypothetical protein